MLNHQLKSTTETESKQKLSLQQRQNDILTPQNERLAQHEPIKQLFGQLGNSATPGTHTSLLNRAAAPHATPTQRALLQLQHQYGNRYVQPIRTLDRKGEGEMIGYRTPVVYEEGCCA